MQENYNFIQNGDVSLYVRRIKSPTPTKKAVILFNSRSLCVESSMAIPMGSVGYADYLAQQGIETFLVDLRGYGMSSSIEEQLCSTVNQIKHKITPEDFYSDIDSSVKYVKSTLGDDCEITLVGFSLLGTFVVVYAHLYPDSVHNVISLNPNWLSEPTDPVRGFNFYLDSPPEEPFIKVSIDSIQQRFFKAQLPGKDFREPTWASEAETALEEYHKTFDKVSRTWKLNKSINWTEHLKSMKNFAGIKANLLFVTSQYDSENPYYIVNRFYNKIAIKNKYFKVLPNATHLCIWEKARHDLYKITAEFVL